MAFNSLLRRASSTVLPLAIRAVGSPRTYHRAISTVLTIEKCSLCRDVNRQTFAPFVRYSTATAEKPSSDESLIRVIESEIECANEPNNKILEDKPENFPFEIEDNTGERTIFLTREYGDEIIKVEVDIGNATAEDEDEDEDDDEDDDDNSLSMVVSISKGNGPCLEFGVTVYPNEITIDGFSMKQSENSENELAYEGPDFNDLDENLQKALHKYLEVRGINASAAQFLHEYMANKDNKEYLVWLNNLKKFVEK